MWKSFSTSLTLRIFLLTVALLIAVSAITYGLIAYLTPLSYTALVEEDLRQQVGALILGLETVLPEDADGMLSDFARDTGADIQVIDSAGDVLYSTLPIEESIVVSENGPVSEVVEDTAIVIEEAIAISGEAEARTGGENMDSAYTAQSGAAAFVGVSENTGEAATQANTDVATAHNQDSATEANAANGYPFVFADGTAALLTAQGGMRAVNQAVEALTGVLPYLVAAILLISVAASFFYARFITRPIVAMRDIAKRMSALDFDARWEKRRGDEIGDLGRSLNTLSDNLSGALANLSDANRKLQSDIDRERAIERQRMAFFSAASHELKTPITILKGQLSGMLAQVGIYRDREKYLARALAVTGRMENLVKEILMINRIETAGFSLKADAINLSALMQKQLSLDAELMEQKELTLITDITPGVTVHGDEALLANAIDNVLINAILYSPVGASIYATVSAGTFSIENTDVFIQQDALAELFTPFFRVEQSRNRKSGGSGLGLYLVKSILDLHGASCEIRNTARGVLFLSVFPAGEGLSASKRPDAHA